MITHIISEHHRCSSQSLPLASFSAKIVFSVPFKLSKLTPFIRPFKNYICRIKHRPTFAIDNICRENVVYSLPLTCGKVYIGQTGKCITKRLQQHLYSLKRTDAVPNNLSDHCRNCNNGACAPLEMRACVLGIEKNYRKRLLLETVCIMNSSFCISSPSLALSQSEAAIVMNTCGVLR